MESYIFDIILITLAVVILIHLFYNNALFTSGGKSGEHMANMETYKGPCNVKPRVRNDVEYRDPGTVGIDRTYPDRHPWYHVTNKLVTKDGKNAKVMSKYANDTSDNMSSNSDTPDNMLSDTDSQQVAVRRDGYCTLKGKDSYNLIFDDKYEGKLTSDP